MSHNLYKPSSNTLFISEIDTTEPFTQLFERVQHLPYAMLFDTSGGNTAFGRYNIMLWAPSVVVESRHGKTRVTISNTGQCTESSEAPLKVLDNLQRAALSAISIDTNVPTTDIQALPFLIGSAGLAGYDLGRYYEVLPENACDEYVCPDLAVGLFEQSVIEDTATGKRYFCRLCNIEAPDFPVVDALDDEAESFRLTSNWQSNLTQQQYVSALHQIHEYLLAGDCYQVNMAQRFKASYIGNEWQAYQTLSAANKAPFSAFFRLPESTVISISPERFLSVREGKVETKPIKGTRPRFVDAKQDKASADALLAAEKDRAENLMIVDLLRNDLSKHCKPGTVEVPALFALESYEAVHHMVSTVTGELNDDASPLDLLAGAFPGGSITGAPKIRAMEIIDELEPHRRNVYCGSIFYLGFRQDMDSSILIRTLLAEQGNLYCWAGGGIVVDSQPDEEYQETLDKVSRILPTLKQFMR